MEKLLLICLSTRFRTIGFWKYSHMPLPCHTYHAPVLSNRQFPKRVILYVRYYTPLRPFFVYSEDTVCTYAMKKLNANGLMLPPPPLLSIIFTATSKLLRYFLIPKDSSRYLNHSFP